MRTSNEEIRKTNPKIFMVPAICMNDIKDPDTYKAITDYMYTTVMKKRDAEIGARCTKINLPTSIYENPKRASVSHENRNVQ